MKIGILTLHSSHNYGAFLQAYALCHYINEQTTHNAEIINYSTKLDRDAQKRLIQFNRRHLSSLVFNLFRYRMFIHTHSQMDILSGECIKSDDKEIILQYIKKRQYDMIIVGSDEVLKISKTRPFPNVFWLSGIDGMKKVFYAASSRMKATEFSDQVRKEMRECLNSYSYIGVRDLSTKEFVEELGGKNCYLNCDPTFLYDFKIDKKKGKEMIKQKFGISGKKKCIALMVGEPRIAYEIIKKYHDKYDFISLYNYYQGTKGFAVLNPFEFVAAIAGADMLITNYFHGTVFAIKSETPFLSIESRTLTDLYYSKLYDFLSRNDCARFLLVDGKDTEKLMLNIEHYFEGFENGTLQFDFEAIIAREKCLADSFLSYLKSCE